MQAGQLTINWRGWAQPTLTVAGNLDRFTCHNLITQAIDALHSARETLTIDGAGITACDSAGLRSLVSLYKAGRALGVVVYLRNPSPALARAITTARLTDIFPVLPASSDGRSRSPTQTACGT